MSYYNKKKLVAVLIAAACLMAFAATASAAVDGTGEPGRIIQSAALGYSGGKITLKTFNAQPGANIVYSVNGGEQRAFDKDAFAIDASAAEIGDSYELVLFATMDGYPDQAVNVYYTFTVKDYAVREGLNGYYILKIDGQPDGLTFAFNESYKAASADYFFFSESSVTMTVAPKAPFIITGASIDFGRASIIPGDAFVLDIAFLEGITGASYVYTASVDVDIPDPNYDPNAPVQHRVTARAGSGGSVFPSGDVYSDQGTNPAFLIFPDDGYVVDCVYLDGEPKGAINIYAFWNIAMSHDLNITFKEDTGAVDPSAAPVTYNYTPSIPRTGAEIHAAAALLAASGAAALLKSRRRTSK